MQTALDALSALQPVQDTRPHIANPALVAREIAQMFDMDYDSCYTLDDEHQEKLTDLTALLLRERRAAIAEALEWANKVQYLDTVEGKSAIGAELTRLSGEDKDHVA